MFTKWLMADSTASKHLKRFGMFTLLLTVTVSASGCALLPDEEMEETLPAITPPKLSQKPVYTVATDTLETKVRGIGELKSEQMEQLFFVEGDKRVLDVYVKPGESVAAGELLAELDVTVQERDLRTRKLKFRQNELAMIEVLRKADEMEPEELEQAKIDFELARSEIVDIEENIERAKIYASFDGTVTSVQIAKGDQVQAYTPVITVADMQQLVVAATISKDDVKSVAIGMDTTVSINSAGDFKGKVSQLPTATTTNNNNNNYPNVPQKDTLDKYLLVAIEPFPEGLNLGTPLSVVVVTNRKENATVIPSAALRTHAGRNYVQVVENDGSKREVDVEIGQQTSTAVEIVSGLTPGQKVVGR
jgi:macrolide-specific efflux system membrane fusion protein